MKPPSKIGWLDMIVDDPETTTQFYENVFGFKREPCNEPDGSVSYALHDDEDNEVLGIVSASAFPNWLPRWIPYLDVTDYDASVAQIEASGGRIHQEHTANPNKRSCLATDPSGAPVMLCEAQKTEH